MQSGCTDVGQLVSPHAASATVTPASSDAQHQALAELTRDIAMALGDASMRVAVGHSMKSAGVTREFKLEFAPLMHGPLGRRLLGRVASAAGITSDSVLRLVDALPAMEFYMPLRRHRHAWAGEDVYVASQLNKADRIVAFDDAGNPVSLDPKNPPLVPTFSIVRSETDFRAAHVTPGTVSGGRASKSDLGTGCDETKLLCSEEDVVTLRTFPGVVPTYAPSGIYMTYANVSDLREDELMHGAPEMEVHIFGPRLNHAANDAADLHCSGQNVSPPYWFNMNDHSWSGSVMVISEADLIANNLNGVDLTRQISIVLYEDDDQSCVIKDDGNRLWSALGMTGYYTFAAVGMLDTCTWQHTDRSQIACGYAALGLTAAAYAVTWIPFWETHDDLIGIAAPLTATPELDDHWLASDIGANGTVQLVYHKYGY